MWPVRHEAIFGSSFRLAPLSYRHPFFGSVCRTLAPFRSARDDHGDFALLISDPKPTSRSQFCRTSSNAVSVRGCFSQFSAIQTVTVLAESRISGAPLLRHRNEPLSNQQRPSLRRSKLKTQMTVPATMADEHAASSAI